MSWFNSESLEDVSDVVKALVEALREFAVVVETVGFNVSIIGNSVRIG